MNRYVTIFLTGLAPAIWGSTYLVVTQLLPEDRALINAALRALPAGLLLLLLTRQLPRLEWIPRLVILGALNFSIFWWLLVEAAYRLPGGMAATVGAVQPLMVYVLSSVLLGTSPTWKLMAAGGVGVIGVALLTLTSDAQVDAIGVLASVGGAFSMALGVVLSKRWQMPISPLAFASWQLIAGGILIAPFAIFLDPALPSLTAGNIIGYTYLSLIGGALTYVFWFRGIVRLGPSTVTTLGFLSPLTAVILGWAILGQSLSIVQSGGVALVLLSVYAVMVMQVDRTFFQKEEPASGPGPTLPAKPPILPSGESRQWHHDPFSHPDIQKMSLRELDDLPPPSPRFRF
ncbi:MAG: EamA family transporter [Rhodobacteraceae bacterium]|nr:EamA family transporter [Paracoccaceae bacterium]